MTNVYSYNTGCSALYIEEVSEMDDQSLRKRFTEHEKEAAFERELADWDKLNAYKPVQGSEVPHADAYIID